MLTIQQLCLLNILSHRSDPLFSHDLIAYVRITYDIEKMHESADDRFSLSTDFYFRVTDPCALSQAGRILFSIS